MPALPLILTALGGFLLGSIPNGFLVAKTRGIDIREHGSKNIGATNVLRVLGKGPGYTVFLLDALKGVAAVVLGGMITASRPDLLGGISAGTACIFGHSFTPWLGFKGGKGVATTGGVLLALLNPLVLLSVLGVWLSVFYTARFVSLASIASAIALPVAVWVFVFRVNPEAVPMLVFSLVVSLLVILRHKTNIARLLSGTESRFTKKESAKK